MVNLPKIRWDENAPVAANARRELPLMAIAYFSQVREFLGKDPAPRRLHQIRLASKRLRYTLEIFRACYPAALEERLDALKQLQNWLGDVNDAVASRKLLRGELTHKPKVRKFLKKREAKKAEEFASQWKESFDAPGQEAWWTSFLAQHAREPRESKN